eukprot:1054000-Prorocentrum_minimum.AAC.1
MHQRARSRRGLGDPKGELGGLTAAASAASAPASLRTPRGSVGGVPCSRGAGLADAGMAAGRTGVMAWAARRAAAASAADDFDDLLEMTELWRVEMGLKGGGGVVEAGLV